ncbi:hypothetical protein CONPUDRAFT_164442 [Coniophora puteana RWD-64-598 SS2]|uniref:F-box domain-containing protein n=1 Tax=Coniophora puteana (strain RWD-64-598) TaxID=741705 RepID=A0A5M3MWL6_CONPW|nr:uncharacterized protein CONPUDRAFT_164442 [Coniophora puteana RWD-64-598 SS2]EIW83516.1 hypothetical protein CONPUDRAFT_164442 [Coniophora puteana RWD-64-598 SS2]
MHPALTLEEILRDICLYFKYIGPGEAREGRQALTSLAKTCRAISAVSLDVLWSSIHFYALFSALPCRAFQVKVNVPRKDCITGFDRSLVRASEWVRFHQYTSRIQQLSLADDPLAQLLVLCQLFPSRFNTEHSFPNLQRLLLPRYHRGNIPWQTLNVFLLPTLREIQLSSYSDGVSAFLRSIPQHSMLLNSLHAFSMSTVGWSAEVGAAYEEALPQMRSLKYYWGPGVSQSYLRQISTLPSLRHMTLMMQEPLYQGPAPPLHSLAFPVLSKLRLCRVNFGMALGIFKGIKDDEHEYSRVLSINIDSMTSPSTGDLHELSAVLARFELLESIVLSVRASRRNEESVSLATIRPLLRCSSLKEVDIETRMNVSFTDTDIEAMGEAWHLLEVLKLNSDTYCKTPPQLTLDGIRVLLSMCPRLRRVGLALRVPGSDRDSPQWRLNRLEEDRAAGRSAEILSSFRLGYSQIIDPTFFCAVMSQLAPNIDYVELLGPDIPTMVCPILRGVKEAQKMAQERNGHISEWSWNELDARLLPLVRR